ncbi:MAG: thrombospondin type 3 repeat-containing protein [Chthoniobacter sp.]|nr:thrombospondin type 3 repeat-containing protein [Chthoniobacter sp.]
MNWIKKRYDQFLLALLTVALLACAVLIFLRVQSFGEKFSDAVATVIPNNKVPPVPLDRIDDAKEKLKAPPEWTDPKSADGKPTRGSMFVSDHYIINAAGTPEKPEFTDLYVDSLTGKRIPSKWFLDNNLPLLDPKVAMQDPDKDGFTNEDEFRAGTDPNNKDSHPPYVSKLFLKRFEKVPFRLVFKAYDGDPKRTKDYSKFSFQIDTLDLRQPSDFLNIGSMVPNTKFKLEKFEFKEAYNEKIQEKEDVSELTLVDTITGDKIVLSLNKITDSPDVYANFEYEWTQPTQMIRVKKLQEFVLKPEVDDTHHYKLIDINDTEAQIKLPDGTDYTVKMDPRHAGK